MATRSPWPAIDGGRVLMAQTIAGLRARGHAITVVAPDPDGRATPPAAAADLDVRLVPVRRRGWIESLVRARLTQRPTAIERHAHPAVAREVRAIARDGVDVIHVQQLHAFAAVDRLAGLGLPIVLRAENAEAELWRQAHARAWWSPAATAMTQALRGWETAALEGVATTACVSDRDAAVLRPQAPLAAIDVVRIPMPAEQPAGPALQGDPAIALMAGAWRPNRDGAGWFLREIWPSVAASLPAARLHVFGGPAIRAAGVVVHARPEASMTAFPAGGIAVVPLRIASGASVKVLEAWSRGLPVVTTPIVAAGVDPGGAAVAIASTAAAFTAAFRRLAGDAEARQTTVAAGRAALVAHHDPADIAMRLERIYEAAIHATAARRRA